MTFTYIKRTQVDNQQSLHQSDLWKKARNIEQLLVIRIMFPHHCYCYQQWFGRNKKIQTLKTHLKEQVNCQRVWKRGTKLCYTITTG